MYRPASFAKTTPTDAQNSRLRTKYSMTKRTRMHTKKNKKNHRRMFESFVLTDFHTQMMTTFLPLQTLLQYRAACKTFNKLFLRHVNCNPSIYSQIVYKSDVVWSSQNILSMMSHKSTLLMFLKIFQPCTHIKVPIDCFFVVVRLKDVQTSETIGVAYRPFQCFTREEGNFTYEMNIEYKKEKDKYVSIFEGTSERWCCGALLDVYILTSCGLHVISKNRNFQLPAHDHFGSVIDLNDNMYASLHSDVVCLHFHMFDSSMSSRRAVLKYIFASMLL